jgi:predicted permease
MTNLRYIVRSLKRSPGFAIVAVLSLGVSLGLASTTFAILDAVVHPHVPYRDADRLFNVTQAGDGSGHNVTWFDKYVEFRDHARVHQEIALSGFGLWGSVQGGGNTLGRVSVHSVTANYFDLLGVIPARGRLFRTGQDYAEEQRSAVVTESLWRKLFGQREFDAPTMTIGDGTYQVIGIVPPGTPPWVDAWILLPPSVAERPGAYRWLWPVVRLKPGITVEQANATLSLAAERLRQRYGTGDTEFAYRLRSVIPDPLRFKRFHAAMAGAAVAVLLIACGNLVNLMLARGTSRRRDVALQLALGASRSAAVLQVLAEVAVLAVAGGLLGALLSVWGVEILVHRLPPEVELVGSFVPHLSWRVFAFGLTATVLSMALSSLLPALAAARVSPAEPLQDSAGTTTGRTRRAYNPLVIAAVAGSITLLMGAGLLFKAARRVGGYDFGFEPRGLMTGSLWLPRDQREAESADATVHRLLDRLEVIDGVQSAAWTSMVVPEDAGVTSDFGRRLLNLHFYSTVSSGFLQTLGIPVVAGRDFSASDAGGGGVVIVDQDAARRLWPGVDPVGRMIKLGGHDAPEEWYPVVGVARAASLHFESDPDLPPEPNVFLLPNSYAGRSMQFVIRVRHDEARAALELRRVLRDAVPGSGSPYINSWLRGFEQFVNAREFMAGLFAVFGLFALGLCSIGLYGVLSYAVSRRVREFGVRIALGAKPGDVLRLVLREGSVMILAGTAIGGIVAMWFAQLLGYWLYDVNPTDAASLVTAELILIAVSLIACAVPGIRASRADPVEVLRAI